MSPTDSLQLTLTHTDTLVLTKKKKTHTRFSLFHCHTRTQKCRNVSNPLSRGYKKSPSLLLREKGIRLMRQDLRDTLIYLFIHSRLKLLLFLFCEIHQEISNAFADGDDDKYDFLLSLHVCSKRET